MAVFRSQRVRNLYAAGLVFNPYAQLDKHIESAAQSITRVFSDVDHSIDGGSSIKRAVKKNQDLQAIFHRVISTSRFAGFQNATLHSRKNMPVLYGHQIYDAASKQAALVNKQMRRTSRRALRNTPDSEYILSADRAIAAARYEAAKSYYAGMADGFRGTGWGKSWATQSANPCDDCSDNEDDGVIDVDDVFSSGEAHPSQHLNCSCFLIMTRG